MFIGAFIVVACFIGVLFIYDYFVPMAGHKPVALEKKGQEVVSAKKAATAPIQKIQDKTSANKTLAKSSTKTFKIPANTEIPRLKEKRQEQVIKHEGYTAVSYTHLTLPTIA